MAINNRVQQLIEAAKKRTQEQLAKAASSTQGLPASESLTKTPVAEAVSRTMTINGQTFNPYYIDGVGDLNSEQSEAVLLYGIKDGTGCLIGPAGTGKTTTTKAVINAMVRSARVPTLPKNLGHKYLQGGLPGIWGGSFTRIATRNLRDNVPTEIKANICTIHKLLEFEPEFIEVYDEEKKREKTIRVFKPTRNKYRPLPSQLQVFIIDEASMPGTNLHAQLVAAIGCANPQFIYIGDIAQLPPVMDESIFGYKLLELKTVELKHVYRHAGAIVNLANHIRTGNTIPEAKQVVPYSTNLRRLPRELCEQACKEWSKEEDGSKVTIRLWSERLDGDAGQIRAMNRLKHFFQKEINEERYNPLKHMILIPYNKSVGSIELNKHIAQHLGNLRKAVVHEVISGFEKHYLAEGDKVFFQREEAIITKINRNAIYGGKIPQKESETLDRWGHNLAEKATTLDQAEMDSIDALLNISLNAEEDEDRKNACSHVIYLKKLSEITDEGEDKAEEYSINTAGEVNQLLMGYALTIHKAQGSQWEKVYCVFHNSHNRNLQRELLYTAITRAQKELYVIAEPETFIQGVWSQHIEGNTLAEKAEYFKGKVNEKLFNQKGEIQ